MKRFRVVLFCVFFTLAGSGCYAGTVDDEALAIEAQSLVITFAGKLKPELKRALKEGGPALAVQVCASAAPAIADSLAAQSGWSVKRISLQPRNATRAIADEWEREVLESFDRRAAQGESPASINTSAVINGQFRHLQAQGVEGVCLLCHGEQIGEAARAALAKYYPEDTATGYTLGQVRGAISVAKKL